MDFHDVQDAAEKASLSVYARAVLARAVQDNPTVRCLMVCAFLDGGEVGIECRLLGADDQPVSGWGQ